METKLKPKTTPVKEVTKSSPATGANSKAPNGANGTTNSDMMDNFILGPPSGVRIAKIRNR